MNHRSLLAPSAALALLVLSSCGVGRTPPAAPAGDGAARVADSCTRCHGSEGDPAPPRSAHGDTSTSAIGVGAHQAHLRDGGLHRAFPCAECHVVPAAGTAHIDGVAQVRFGPVANANGVTSSWNRDTATCATWCHGATLAGGAIAAPVWTGARQAGCGACHGLPPPAPHPATTADCGDCHPGYTWGSVNLATHVDGKVQVASTVACGSCHSIPPPAPHPASMECGSCHPGYTSSSVVAATHANGTIDLAMSCTSCHGDPARASSSAAPPRDTRGDTATTARGVGAHQAHLGATLSAPVACAECHVVPTSPTHASGTVDVTFGALARAGSTAASWNGATCAVYCHGATLAGGTATAPAWTKVDGTQKGCTSCHGAPPPAPHPASSDCGACHAGYTATMVNAATHVNGVVDVSGMSCTSCHGDSARASNPAAPPKDTKGNTATTARGVGAHQAHLGSRLLAAPVACAECHLVPTSPTHANGTVDVSFGALSRTGGAAAAWNGATCAVYCHGATLNAGGTATAPIWTKVDGTQKACTSCHGAPPPAPHPASSDCNACHSGYTATTVNATNHLNGRVDVAGMTCTTCHGDGARTSGPREAPPVDTHGNTATTARGVGAHQKHLGATLSAPVACAECHVVPTSTSHSNGAVEITFGALARAGGAAPAWTGATLTCATTYCHGATLGGGTAKSPLWTKVDGTQVTCVSCHGAPPPAPHTTSTACGSCHAGYTATSVNLATHLNGTVDVVAMSCTSCHGDPARASNPAAPPKDTKGNTATTARGVGAHQAHLSATLAAPVACADCHVVPTSTSHSNGTVSVAFSGRAAGTTWNTTNLTCTTACHGAGLNAGGTATTPVWTTVNGTQKTCGSCHGAPPPAPHTTSTACGSCHAGYTATSVNLATHLNGNVDVVAMTCTSCHGDATRASNPAAPPKDTKGNTATTARGVGAHQAHLSATLAAPVACADCHVVPTSTSHSNGTVSVAFSGRAAGTAWNTSNLTCTTACHGAGLNAGGSATTPVWTTVNGTQKTCGSCHGAPPPAPHTTSTACGSCHTGYTATSVNVATHLNGTVDVVAMSCTSCHGDATRASNPAAPPKDTKGNTATTARGVGAHQAHLSATLAAPVACADCHVVPTSTSHANGTVSVAFSGRAAGTTWNTTNLTCTTACHGAGLNAGGSATTPVWTTVNGTQKTCGSCHGAPPTTGQHGRSQHVSRSCGDCHGSGYTTAAVNVTLHMNGSKNVGGTGSRINSWNPTTRSCAPACHGTETW